MYDSKVNTGSLSYYIVPLGMQRCICHFVKSQIHPFISKPTMHGTPHVLCFSFITIHQMEKKIKKHKEAKFQLITFFTIDAIRSHHNKSTVGGYHLANNQPYDRLVRIFTHLKLCLADALHSFKWVKIIQIRQNEGQQFWHWLILVTLHFNMFNSWW